MSISEKNILNRFYFVAGCMFIFAIIVAIKLINIQFVDGEKYRELALKNTTKNFIISSNRGNIYSDDGSLAAGRNMVRRDCDRATGDRNSVSEHKPGATSGVAGPGDERYLGRARQPPRPMAPGSAVLPVRADRRLRGLLPLYRHQRCCWLCSRRRSAGSFCP